MLIETIRTLLALALVGFAVLIGSEIINKLRTIVAAG